MFSIQLIQFAKYTKTITMYDIKNSTPHDLRNTRAYQTWAAKKVK